MGAPAGMSPRDARARLAVTGAIEAIDAMVDASAEEDRRFAAWFVGDCHVNGVRAAERKHNAAHHDAMDAIVNAIRRLSIAECDVDRIDEATVEIYDARLRDALVAARDELDAKAAGEAS